MATEKQIRDAIAQKIQDTAPLAVVVPRNVLDIKDGGWLGLLQSPAFEDRVRGWMVTLQSQTMVRDRGAAAEYVMRFSVWQFLGYWTGDNANNSEDVFGAEREAVVNVFAGALTGVLDGAGPLQFSLVDLFLTGGDLVHIAQGFIDVETVTPCS